MLTHDYLALCLSRHKRSDEWTSPGNGLSFAFPSNGKGSYVSGSVVHKFGPGDVLVFSNANGGKLCVEDGEEVILRCFSVRLDHLFPLFANHEVYMLQDLQSRFSDSRVYAASTPLAAQCHRLVDCTPPLFNLVHRSHLLRIAAAILSMELAATPAAKSGYVSTEEHMDGVFEQLSTEEILGLSIDDLARKFHCSRRHLNRLFHQRFGLSVSTLRMELRLLKAASLLRDAEAKVINVAEQCGFNHLGLFNTCFKRRFGASPGQWRKQPDGAESHPGALLPGNPLCQLRANGLCPWAGDIEHHKTLVPRGVCAQVQGTPAQPAITLRHNVTGNGHREANSGKPQATLPTGRIRLRA
jgi:AraC-like DNA-binding protein